MANNSPPLKPVPLSRHRHEPQEIMRLRNRIIDCAIAWYVSGEDPYNLGLLRESVKKLQELFEVPE